MFSVSFFLLEETCTRLPPPCRTLVGESFVIWAGSWRVADRLDSLPADVGCVGVYEHVSIVSGALYRSERLTGKFSSTNKTLTRNIYLFREGRKLQLGFCIRVLRQRLRRNISRVLGLVVGAGLDRPCGGVVLVCWSGWLWGVAFARRALHVCRGGQDRVVQGQKWQVFSRSTVPKRCECTTVHARGENKHLGD